MVCLNQGRGVALQDCFQVHTLLSAHCWLCPEQSLHGRAGRKLWKKIPPFWHRGPGSSTCWCQLLSFQSQADGMWIPLTSQLDLMNSKLKKSLLIIVLHCIGFRFASHFPKATKLVTKMLLRKTQAGQCCVCISPKRSWLMSTSLTWVCSSSHWARQNIA